MDQMSIATFVPSFKVMDWECVDYNTVSSLSTMSTQLSLSFSQHDQQGSNDNLERTSGGDLQPESRFFQPGLNPGDPGVKSNPGLI